MYTLNQLTKNLNTMANVVQSLEAEKAMSTQSSINISAQALKIRDHFIKDVGEVLNEVSNIETSKQKLNEKTLKLKSFELLENELNETKKKLKEMERSARAAAHKGDKVLTIVAKNAFVYLDDKSLLSIFSFLTTSDVISAAQVLHNQFKLHFL
jgi:hypothetical protein